MQNFDGLGDIDLNNKNDPTRDMNAQEGTSMKPQSMPGYNSAFVSAESPKAVVLPFGGSSTLEESVGSTLVQNH